MVACAHYKDSAGNDYYYPPFLPGSGIGPVDCASGTCPPTGQYVGTSPQAHGVSITQGTINGRGYTMVRSR